MINIPANYITPHQGQNIGAAVRSGINTLHCNNNNNNISTETLWVEAGGIKKTVYIISISDYDDMI